MPSVEWNRQAWSERHGWQLDGDEWSGMAEHCGQPYPEWKQSLVDTFIDGAMAYGADVIEIAPGHGRWTEHLLDRAASVTVVDINESCLQACTERFDDARHLGTFLTDGASLPPEASGAVDLVWSFDSFVHMDADVVRGYLGEVARVLRPGGRAVIHHAGMWPWSLHLAPVTSRLGRPGRVIQRLAGQGRLRHGGNRSALSRDRVASWALAAGLVVERQTQSWGGSDQYDVRRFNDWISVFRQPLR